MPHMMSVRSINCSVKFRLGFLGVVDVGGLVSAVRTSAVAQEAIRWFKQTFKNTATMVFAHRYRMWAAYPYSPVEA
jgi:hypothetical protein